MKPKAAIKITVYIVAFVACLLFAQGKATAQVSRLNFASQTTSGQCVPGSQCPVLAIPGSTVTVCTYAVGGCGATATTYTDASGTTACPSFSQVTPGCVSTVDNNGNGGVWISSGNYNVFFTPPGGSQVGPFYFTAGGGGGGSGSCPQGPNTSVQVSNGAACAGSGNLTYAAQTLTSVGSGGNPAFVAQSGTFQSLATAYNGVNSPTDGIAVRAYDVSQNQSQLAGGYLVFNPISYNPYDQSGQCLDQFGNVVRQPLPLPGTSFGTFASVLWVGESPSMPPSPTAGCPTPGGPPLPVNPSAALQGLNTNSYFFARGGLATDDGAYNSIDSLLGGIHVKLGATIEQGSYYLAHTLGTINSPSGTYGGFGYVGGPVYQYFNAIDMMWHSFDFSTGGGTGCVVGAPALAILSSNGSGCTGTANAEVDTNGNLSLAGSGSVLAINGATGGVSVTADTQYNSIHTVGGFASNLGLATQAGITVVGATSQTANLAEFYTHTPTLVARVDKDGKGLFASLKVTDLAGGGGQCVQVDNTGQASGTGSTCGTGGGGSPGAPTTSVQTNQGGVFTGSSALTWDNTNDVLRLINGGPEFSSAMVIDSGSITKASYLQFTNNGVLKWAMGGNDSTSGLPYSFQIYDNAAAAEVLLIGSGAAQDILFSPTSGTVQITGKAATAGLAIATGYGQADGGFLATNAVCVSYSCFNSQTGGAALRSANIANYVSLASATASPTSGDNWSSNPGVMYYNTTGSPTWYFLHGTGASTAADAVVHGDSFVGTNTSVSFNASGAFDSAATGTNLTFENNTGCFSVNGNGVIQGGCPTSGVNLTAATAFNSMQTTGGILSTTGTIAGTSLSSSYLMRIIDSSNSPGINLYNGTAGSNTLEASWAAGATAALGVQSGSGSLLFEVLQSGAMLLTEHAAPSVSSAGQFKMYADQTSHVPMWSENGSAYVTFSGGGGGGVSSINGLTGALGIASDFGIHSLSAGCAAAGSTIGVIQSCNTGAAITFQNQNSNFSVDGSGDISMAGNLAILGNCNSGPCASWTVFSPTVTGFSAGVVGGARYTRWGHTVFFSLNIAGSSTGANPTFSLPVTPQGGAGTLPMICVINVSGTLTSAFAQSSGSVNQVSLYNGGAFAPVPIQVLCNGSYESN